MLAQVTLMHKEIDVAYEVHIAELVVQNHTVREECNAFISDNH